MDQIVAWHFLSNDGCLRYGAGQRVQLDTPIEVAGPPELCWHGLHASRRALDALRYAPGHILCRVVLGGAVVEGDDKLVGTVRTAVWMGGVTSILRQFARECALSVLSAWYLPVPDIVRRYLETGTKDLRRAAESAARSAAESAARSAAQGAARGAVWSAAESAAWSAAWSAVWSAAQGSARRAAQSAAWSAAESAAWSAAQGAARRAAWSAAESAQNERLETLLFEHMQRFPLSGSKAA